ncbi:hypothetical protein AQJ91_46345 [Streptomyces dysideae]|uniref:Uncharacterized protein n=1 Tax=Streptomyces dysideae TaxID=909626 RepID=A0A124IDA4_9ACTN|nr:hypothetical protein AQJ91_46345 [Streptomyces dysideae]
MSLADAAAGHGAAVRERLTGPSGLAGAIGLEAPHTADRGTRGHAWCPQPLHECLATGARPQDRAAFFSASGTGDWYAETSAF